MPRSEAVGRRLGAVLLSLGCEAGCGEARSSPPLRGLLGAFSDIAGTSFALALLLSVTIETCGGGRKRAEGSFRPSV